LTGNPHLTRRWPFGRVTEGLPTIRDLNFGEAGLTDHVWTMDELVALLPKPESVMRNVDAAILRKALGETS
jgi:hypothetical protein